MDTHSILLCIHFKSGSLGRKRPRCDHIRTVTLRWHHSCDKNNVQFKADVRKHGLTLTMSTLISLLTTRWRLMLQTVILSSSRPKLGEPGCFWKPGWNSKQQTATIAGVRCEVLNFSLPQVNRRASLKWPRPPPPTPVSGESLVRARDTMSSVAVRRALDLEKSAAIQRFNVYFTRHFLSMDSKTHNQTNTTGVAINILTSIMSSVQPGWSDKPCACLACVCVCVRAAGGVCANSCDGSRCEELACHWLSMMSPVWRGQQMGRAQVERRR